MTDVTEIQHCEVCGSTDLTLKLDLGEHPLCDYLIPVHEIHAIAVDLTLSDGRVVYERAP